MIEKNYTKQKNPLPEWLDSYMKQDLKVSCLFGEHLLKKYPFNPIALVEAPKTAIYGTLYFGLPESHEDLIWLAVYNKSSFSIDKLKVLQGRKVVLFPDLSKDGSTFKEWQNKALEYESRLQGTRFVFSDLLEQLAPPQDKEQGKDIADYLIQLDWRKFRKQKVQELPQPEIKKSVASVVSVAPKTNIILPLPKVEVLDIEKTSSWKTNIKELETYFNSIQLPNEPIKTDSYSTIIDVSKFIDSHLSIVKANQGKLYFLPYLHRLQDLKQFLTNN